MSPCLLYVGVNGLFAAAVTPTNVRPYLSFALGKSGIIKLEQFYPDGKWQRYSKFD